MSNNLKKKSLNNRVNEYGIFLKAINTSIALDNSTDIAAISAKNTSLSICKIFGLHYGFNVFLQNSVIENRFLLKSKK